MAGAMRKMAVYLGLVEDDRYDDEYYDDGPRNDDRSGSSDRQNDRIGSAKTDRYGERHTSRADDTVRITEREDDDLARRRQSAERPPARDWRSDTMAQEPVGSHPAGSRPKATPRPTPRTVDPMKITTLHPRSYNDARRIGEEFRSGNPVIMNLTELDDTDAKRIVDFAAGLVFGLRGSIERVTNKVFMLSPANVSVNAEDARASLQQRGLANRG